MPSPRKQESQKDFVQRCMSNEESKRSFPDTKQRVAFCNSQWEGNKGDTGRQTVKDLMKQFVGPSEASNHILNKAGETYADEKAGYPPDCNEGYYEKNGKCVPMDYTEGPTEAGSKYKCPYDNLDTVWTGRTKTILSKIFYVMRCPHGHETDSKSPK